MKKLFVACLLGLALSAAVSAQSGNTYFNIGLIGTRMAQPEFPELRSNYGIDVNIGQTFPLIGGSFCIGVDFTWLDVAYTDYKIKHITSDATNSYRYGQWDLAMQLGPCLSISMGSMRLHGYFRYAPTYSILTKPEAKYGNYATNFVTGGSLTFGAIGLGAEYRFGDCRYKQFGPHRAGPKTEFTGLRAYLAFRF